ncbi:MAG: 4-hydroxythreonine-4-phosphate dehydrogenase PdxA [Candidatus Aminicenantes bacterium]|nr:4-hydroxythreonine-4-phosphate dehydrogenase PdxA [Candidatus Aminicenantes bacterium]
MNLPKIGISLGDPGGIGPEVTIKALSSPLPKAEYIVFGPQKIVHQEKEELGLNVTIRCMKEALPLVPDKKGSPSAQNGKISFACFQKCVEAAREGLLHAVVTAPISKESWAMAGIPWSGHTDFLHHLYPEAIMAFWSDALKVALLSHHISLKEAVAKVKKDILLDFLLTLFEQISRLDNRKFTFLAAGLNPHAGEKGLLGKEEVNEILPAIRMAQKKGMPIEGPFPPDVIFRKALNQPKIFVIALYHDQGLIPFKLMAFDSGVNVTLGLPFYRTSPDHGTAFDIVGKGKANPESMISALKLAHRWITSSTGKTKLS